MAVVPDGLTQDLTATKHVCEEAYIGLPVLKPWKERLWLDIDDAEKKGQDHVCLDLRFAPASCGRAHRSLALLALLACAEAGPCSRGFELSAGALPVFH